jgi:hypothetical protein
MDVMKSSLAKSINIVKEKAAASIEHLQNQQNTNRTNQSKASHFFSSSVQRQLQTRQQREGKDEVTEVLEWVHHEFFLACQKNNCLRAYELYTMPYHECVKAMVQQQQQHEEQEQQHKQEMMDKLLFRKKDLLSSKGWFKVDKSNATLSTDNLISSGENHMSSATHSIGTSNPTTTLGFLEEQKHPFEFFPPSYFSTLLQQQSALAKPTALAQKLKEKIMKKGFMTATTNSQQQLSPTAASSTATPITTTLLHEVARLGYPPLLRRMLLFQKRHCVDLSIQDWKQRTVLHYVCGGSNSSNDQEDQDNSLRSFYQCTIDQKRRKGKERFTQVLRNKLDIDWTKQLLSETKSEIARLLPSSTTTKSSPTPSDTTTGTNSHSNSNPSSTKDEETLEKDISNRLECLLIIFSIAESHHYHRAVRINTVDCRVRTALHYASSLNRYALVRALLSQPDILVSIIDEGGRTACDLSSSEDVQDILEAKALFSSEEDYGIQLQQQQQKPWFETWDATRIDLEQQSIIKTAQNLIQQQYSSSPSVMSMIPNYPLCATLLEKYNWNVETFVSSFIKEKDPLRKHLEGEEQTGSHESATHSTCLICYSTDVDDADWTAMKDCPHGFCTSCLHDYITTNYVNPTTRTLSIPTLRIPCPHHECQSYISESQLSMLVPPQDLATLKQGERELFILSFRPQRFKFCPHVGCSGIVHASPPLEYQSLYGEESWKYMGAICTGSSPTCTSSKQDSLSFINTGSFSSKRNQSVHRFCFSCGSLTPHWPASCDYHAQWVATVEEQMKGISSSTNFDDVAHHLWLKANTRPCPKCNTPIEKNDGCNHMICLNRHCRYEFCWICRKDWSLHSTSTGGKRCLSLPHSSCKRCII